MKTTEMKMLWQLVKSGETRPLSAADMALGEQDDFVRVQFFAEFARQVLVVKDAALEQAKPRGAE